ncbi:aquaporin [Streptomyces sp. NPDC057611]|uniref:aquaporin n=1 Tax=Streptomyces sp. NPDC057611 TaxID=3346182 RepID=UPI00367C54F4
MGFSFAFVIAAAVYVFGPISGAHINPAVTIALAAIRRFPWREVVPYVVAQLGGALGGGLLVNVIFGSSALTANVSGGTVVQPGHAYPWHPGDQGKPDLRGAGGTPSLATSHRKSDHSCLPG